jgi:hypothetical protein
MYIIADNIGRLEPISQEKCSQKSCFLENRRRRHRRRPASILTQSRADFLAFTASHIFQTESHKATSQQFSII